MQVNAKLEEKDKALQNVSQAKYCYNMKKIFGIVANLFCTQAREISYANYFSLAIGHEGQIFVRHCLRWTIFTFRDIRKFFSVHARLYSCLYKIIQHY